MTLSILWFVLIAVLWIGYLTLEGFDFGVGMLLKILGRDERERRATLATIGPHWDGNEVWLLTAGGATFAAFPEWYSTLFSGAYIVLFIILLCLIVRVCAIEWRPKVNSQTWRDRWDWVHTISAWLPSVLWGVAFANLVQGMHIEVVQISNGAVVPAGQVPADSLMPGAAHQITGGLLTMVTPFTLLGGAVTCLLFLNHGALFVALKTTGELSQRALRLSRGLAPVSTGVTAAWALWAQLVYSSTALSWIPLVIAAAGLIGSLLAGRAGREGRAFALHFVGIAFAVIFIFAAMAPNVMRSSVDPAYSLTIQQAASADTTLLIMTVAAAVFVPGVLIYTVWSYKVFASRISAESINPNQGGLHPTLVRDSAQPEAHFGY
ncbi:cytochrome d ubiquinol oxidase subunit II [Actinomyces viscosus]|uniref:Cytochrome d ubiquinol oxidase subunit 2 n=1 Tax=Actinomyces viscosus TaxID=1656 RepID=A0A3S4Z717_ACTVI|nr:cytochrome d ubiquinol oxidase subunit II [Actinomyces viscosus]TFH53491.1 cytochrome d ubiquinol oxidase subunit II [Actinomyces viscosus]VEI14558.1 Cytochrome d ubiquinol oxidase subunit 2 [Actinomyces viscosus]